MFAIYKKELRSYFINAIGYVFVGVFLAAAAFLCTYFTLGSFTYNTGNYFSLLIFSFIILIPLLTMKLFAEEKKLRTEQLLLTAPVTIWGMVMGKFLAAVTLFSGCLVVSCINFIPLYAIALKVKEDAMGESHIGPENGKIIACLVGVALIGIAFISIGMFVSSLTENQLAAAVVTVTVILIMILLDYIQQFIEVAFIKEMFTLVSVVSRFGNFTQGLLDWSAILYYLSVSGVFLLLTVRVYDKRRWG